MMITIANSNLVEIAFRAHEIARRVNVITGMLIYADTQSRATIDEEIERINQLLAELPRQIAEISQPELPSGD